MDLVPSLMVSLAGMIATLGWSMFRSTTVATSFRRYNIYGFFPTVAAWLLFVGLLVGMANVPGTINSDPFFLEQCYWNPQLHFA